MILVDTGLLLSNNFRASNLEQYGRSGFALIPQYGRNIRGTVSAGEGGGIIVGDGERVRVGGWGRG